LSIMSEIVAVRRGGSGRPMAESAAHQVMNNLDQPGHELPAATLPAAVSIKSKDR
jgi:hypothetical protein